MNYGTCAALRGIAQPDQSALEAAKTKPELVKFLKDSFEYCDPAFRSLADQKLLMQITSGERKFYPVTEMVGLTNSLHEHYGNIIGYLRGKGITPPSTRRTQRVLE